MKSSKTKPINKLKKISISRKLKLLKLKSIKKSDVRKKTLAKIKENQDFIKRQTEFIKKLKKESKEQNNSQLETAVKVHLGELWAVMRETEKLKLSLKNDRNANKTKKN